MPPCPIRLHAIVDVFAGGIALDSTENVAAESGRPATVDRLQHDGSRRESGIRYQQWIAHAEGRAQPWQFTDAAGADLDGRRVFPVCAKLLNTGHGIPYLSRCCSSCRCDERITVGSIHAMDQIFVFKW